jgi:hypothetical protein
MQVFLLKSADDGADRWGMSESNGHPGLIDDLTSVVKRKTSSDSQATLLLCALGQGL